MTDSLFCLDDLVKLFNLLAIQEVPRTCEYIAFHGKRDFADVTKSKHLEIEQPVLACWAQFKYKGRGKYDYERRVRKRFNIVELEHGGR